jgi:hypothetical protein
MHHQRRSSFFVLSKNVCGTVPDYTGQREHQHGYTIDSWNELLDLDVSNNEKQDIPSFAIGFSVPLAS